MKRKGAVPAGLRLIAGWGVLAALAFAGALISQTAVPRVPGAIIGLFIYLLLLALAPRWSRWTLPAAERLASWLGALIVPAAISLVGFAALLGRAALPLALVLAASTLVTALVTALVYRMAAPR